MKKLALVFCCLLFTIYSGIHPLASKEGSKGVTIKHNKDGSVFFIYPNGTRKRVSMDGKTPSFAKVNEVERVVKAGRNQVRLLYTARYSDTDMSKYVMNFYKEVYKQLKRYIGTGELAGKADLLISHCRFCKTGYCGRTNSKGVTVQLVKGTRVIKKMRITYESFLRKKGLPLLTKEILDTLIK